MTTDESSRELSYPIENIPEKIHDTLPADVRAVLNIASVQWEYTISKLCWLLRVSPNGINWIDRYVDDSELQDTAHVQALVHGMWQEALRGN